MRKLAMICSAAALSALMAGCTITEKSASMGLTVKPESTVITTTDGKPFLWIGDTAWEIFQRLSKEEVQFYLDNRKEKGFTVIQGVALFGRSDTPNFYGEIPMLDNDPMKPNEKYFEFVDFVVDEAAARGMYVAILPTWAHNVVKGKDGKSFFDVESARFYGKYMGERYKDKPVIWILGGDRNVVTDDEYDIWESMAHAIYEATGGKQMMSYHPTGEISSHYWFHNDSWLTFNIVQSGHYRKFDKVYRFGATYNQLVPKKPFVNAEPAYEDIAVRFWEQEDFAKHGKTREDVISPEGRIIDTSVYELGFFDDYNIRNEAYWTYFSGAAGYTYGNNAVWQMYKPGRKGGISVLYFWDEALDRPGADDMRHISKLFTAYPLDSFHVDLSAIHGINLNEDKFIPALVANDGTFIMAYMNKGQNVRIDTRKLNAPGKAYWFDPREGEVTEIGEVGNTGIESFDPPGEEDAYGNDWVLIIDSGAPRF